MSYASKDMAMAAKKAESRWGEKVVERGNEGDGEIGSEAGVVERMRVSRCSLRLDRDG